MNRSLRFALSALALLVALSVPALAAEAATPVLSKAAAQLVGTWLVHVPGATPAEDFDALQTFHADGTFTETSSLLGRVPEGPAHGIWRETPSGILLTFHVFTFDEQGNYTGRVRVRNRITLNGPDKFTSNSTVDVLPNGAPPILAVAQGPYSAVRLRLQAP